MARQQQGRTGRIWGGRHSCLLLSLVIAGLPALAQQEQPPPPASAEVKPSISVNTELVDLPVSVTDGKGNFVTDLKKENFQVYEDGQLQNITVFEHGDIPVTVGLVVDHSGSMRNKLPQVGAAAAAFAQSSNPKDEMFVVDFNDNVSLQLMGGKPFTSDARELEAAVSEVSARGRTALYDAIAAALRHLDQGHWQKKAVIVVTDGGDNASTTRLSQVLELAEHSQAEIYCIGLLDENEEENPGVLRRLSKATGGLAFFPRSVADVAGISKQIARDLREQYTIGYAPSNARPEGTFRKIRVKVTSPDRGKLYVRTRTGYSISKDKTRLQAETRSGTP
jgi:Ca-activated chloride channel family protein